MVYLILFACFLVPLGIALGLARAGAVSLTAILSVLCGLAMAWALWKGQSAQGWDGLGYGIFAMLMAAPAGLGFALGGAIGWWKWGRAP